MNKKLLSTVMAGAMLATSVALVFAWKINEEAVQHYELPDTPENRERVSKQILDILY